MSGAEAASSSTVILLGLPRLLRCLISELYDTVHKNDNLYPLDFFKTKGIF